MTFYNEFPRFSEMKSPTAKKKITHKLWVNIISMYNIYMQVDGASEIEIFFTLRIQHAEIYVREEMNK